MSKTIKFIGIRYFKDEHDITEFELSDPDIKQTLAKFIHESFYRSTFEKRPVNCMLTQFNDVMYLLEPNNLNTHIKTQIDYHPLMNLLK